MATMKIASALVQIELATVSYVTAATGAFTWRHAFAAILTGLIADS